MSRWCTQQGVGMTPGPCFEAVCVDLSDRSNRRCRSSEWSRGSSGCLLAVKRGDADHRGREVDADLVSRAACGLPGSGCCSVSDLGICGVRLQENRRSETTFCKINGSGQNGHIRRGVGVKA
jgi:hypothetical protein